MSAPSPATRMFIAFLFARLGFGVVFLAQNLGKWPVPWYYPLERRWAFTNAPEGLAMGWFGATALALVAAGALGGAAYFLVTRSGLGERLAGAPTVRAIAHAGALVLLVDFAYFGWKMTHQTPKPLDAPWLDTSPGPR